MKIAGLTIAKNCNKFAYPIAECIEQHKDFFDIHIIGVPFKEQDNDYTTELIKSTCSKLNLPFCYEHNTLTPDIRVMLYRLDWPNIDTAWSHESQDKILQQKIINDFDWAKTNIDWTVKIDADEFYNDNDIEYLKAIMEVFANDDNTTTIAHNYLQFMGSLEYTVYDPTSYVCHIFKPGKAKFAGNDAMQFVAVNGDTMYIDDVYLHHIGYVKNPEFITTRIKEHLVLNGSMYQDAVKNATKWEQYKFESPIHKPKAKLWPIGISDKPNEIEYRLYDVEKLPSVLKNKVDSWRFYTPSI